MDDANLIRDILLFLDLYAAVHSLLQAIEEIAAHAEGQDRDVHVLLQRSLVIHFYLAGKKCISRCCRIRVSTIP